jgi:glycosyltransferase involved in cell wall biosynthesis
MTEPNSLKTFPSPAVTIVLPVFNGERFLREALDSIFSQTLQDWELIIGDDQSNDRSAEIIASYRDERLRYLRNIRRRGIFGNLNDLISVAGSEYIKIFCQDDVMEPACLAQQLQFMREKPSLAFSRVLQLASDTRGFREQDASLRRLPESIPPSAAALAFFLFGNIPGNLSNVMLRATAWRRAGGFREDLPYAGDMEFWFRVATREPFGVLHERLNFVRAHDGQASVFLNRNNELVPQADEVLETIYQHLPAITRARKITRLWGTINFVVHSIHHGMHLVRVGGTPNMSALMRRRSYAYPFAISCLLYVLTANRRIGLHALREQLMSDLSQAFKID